MEIKPMNYNPAYVAALPSDLFRWHRVGVHEYLDIVLVPDEFKVHTE